MEESQKAILRIRELRRRQSELERASQVEGDAPALSVEDEKSRALLRVREWKRAEETKYKQEACLSTTPAREDRTPR
jgi:hypothetical protein